MSAYIETEDFIAERDDSVMEIEDNGDGETARLTYTVTSIENGNPEDTVSSEPEDAYLWAKENLPATFIGLNRNRIRYAETVSDCNHVFELNFSSNADSSGLSGKLPEDANGNIINPYVSINTTGKTERKFYSIETVNWYLADGSGLTQTEDFKGGINVGSSGPQGVDVVAPNFSWNEKWYFLAETVSWEFLKSLGDYTGTTNTAAFRGMPQESVLFTGAYATPEANKEYIAITFNFQYSSGGTKQWFPLIYSEQFDKKGWHYAWVKYFDMVGPNGMTNKMPIQLNIEKVYFDNDFETYLGIGADLPATANIPLTYSGEPTPA